LAVEDVEDVEVEYTTLSGNHPEGHAMSWSPHLPCHLNEVTKDIFEMCGQFHHVFLKHTRFFCRKTAVVPPFSHSHRSGEDDDFFAEVAPPGIVGDDLTTERSWVIWM
jgi:hypothetical protein